MKFTFWVSHPGKNSVRDKVIDKKRIYLETHSTDRVWAISEGEGSTKVGSFYRGGQFHRPVSEKAITAILGKKCGDFQELGT